MVSREYVFLLLVAGVSVYALLLCYAGAKQHQAAPTQLVDDRGCLSQEPMQQRKVAKRHSKITVPAEISIDLADSSSSYGPVAILISA
jgi:hypothetical protein